MKKIIFFISLILLLASCDSEPVDFNSTNIDYSIALDTLTNYDNYFIGEFNGELLVSTERFTVGGAV